MGKNSIAKDTIILTAIQIFLQTLSLLLNIFITRNLGSSTVGIASLIYTFYGFAAVISTGNIFISTSRFVSEEISRETGNPQKIFLYAIFFCISLSISVSSIIFIFSNFLGSQVLKNPNTIYAIKIISFCLPLSALSSCIKGYFHAYRKILIPSASEALEFFIRSGIISFLAVFMVKSDKMSIFSAIAISILISEILGCLFLIISFLKSKVNENTSNKASISFLRFIRLTIPIILNSYIISILSSTNEALLPLTLKQFGNSTNLALSQYGIFEAIILPTIFFPSVVLCCLSCILVPEISRERVANNHLKVSSLIEKTLKQTFIFSIFIVIIMFTYGKDIGIMLSGDAFSGNAIVVLAPVIPFIYLEIILEGILRGLGKHSFSTLNYLVEYIIRISVLLICVPLIGFYGIIISYFASNIICNISRIVIITKTTNYIFDSVDLVLVPAFSAIITWQLGAIFKKIIPISILPTIIEIAIYSIVTGIIYIFINKVIASIKQNQSVVKDKKLLLSK
ncbi:MAG: oligosaccharide flippase family protein [Clostridiales bacterium]|nr:oligosaccharide flippase family protein [Clostridiales bacterium]